VSNLISAEQIGHSFNDRWLFKNLTIGINYGQKIALVGVNGAGKTTLMQILAGKLPPQEGKVVKNKDIRVAYLEQEPHFDLTLTISDYIFSVDNLQQQLIKKYESLMEQEHPDENEINMLMDEISANNAWEYEYKIKHILGMLDVHHLQQEIKTLSGGQRKRLALAKLLIEDADLYVMDEPTNHLDIDTIEWMEKYLNSGNKSLLMVTHDRYFLDEVCNEIIELENGKVFSYKGNYSYYLEKKAEREANEGASLQKNLNLLRKELEWMRRQPKARTTKSQARIDSFYDLEEKTKGKKVKQEIELKVKVSNVGSKILELHHVGKSFGDRKIMEDFTYTFKRKDRIGVAGKNGTGKSTFLNLITGKAQPDKGKISIGETTVFGYYHQQGLQFDENERVVDVVKNVADFITMADGTTLSASALLTRFLFPPAKQHDKVFKLSGGEKKRLQLMRVLMLNPNFLILDEPTNDLDIDTLNVLEEFLMNYSGCLVLVSHDRYLVDKLTDQLFIFEGEGHVRIYNGNYTEYRLEKAEEEERLKIAAKQSAVASPQSSSGIQSTVDAQPVKKKLSYKEQKELEKLESEIPRLEARQKELTEKLNSGIPEHSELISISKELENIQEELDTKGLRWLELIEN
jgi:ABC transport system ATP-binding/permease protein